MTNSVDILSNIEQLRVRIRLACARANRPEPAVRCIAVTKGHPASVVRAAVAAGLTDIGENRVQEAESKLNSLGDLEFQTHLIGSLQSNKVRPAVRLFDMIQSVDRLELADALQKECTSFGDIMDILIQIEISGEPTKHGVALDAAKNLVSAVRRRPNLRLRGLMAIGPNTADTDIIRSSFRAASSAYESFKRSGECGEAFDTLSMGMSGDFEIAIEEGSTMIRVGTVLFGERPQ